MGKVTKWIVTLLLICFFTSNLALGNSEKEDHISWDSANENCRVMQIDVQKLLTKNENDIKKGGAAAAKAKRVKDIIHGLKYVTDQKCKGINECSTKKHDCDKNAVCKDTDLAFSCTCKPGYKGDGLKCIADASILKGYPYKPAEYPESAKCESDEDCFKGRARCIRKECHCTGHFVGDGKTKCDHWKKCPHHNMYDKREPCGIHIKGKMAHSFCLEGKLNPHGHLRTSHVCKCHDGYIGRANHPECVSSKADKTGRGACVLEHNCHELARCKHNKCYCLDGYDGDGDVCVVGKHGGTKCFKDSHCPSYSFCEYEKCKCKTGLVGNGGTCKPEPLADCATHSFCSVNASCINGKCICKGKTVGTGRECREYQPCPKGTNYCGKSTICLVDPFFPTKCAALDECEKKGIFCPRFSSCMKEGIAAPSCVCMKGFRRVKKDKEQKCEDINECKENKHNCSIDRVCQNRLGGFDCLCQKGLRLDYDGKCVPLDKCDERGNTCSPNSKCKKIRSGSYDCVCIEGYKDVHFGENLKKCEDVNECLTAEAKCSGDRCRNTQGSYTCVPCLPGFTENDEGICVVRIKGACNCDEKTEECKRGKCRCKTALGYKRNNKGRCVRPPGFSLKDQKSSAHSSYFCIQVIILMPFWTVVFTA